MITRNSANTLANGNYRLDIDSSLVSARDGGPSMEADYDFGADPADEFYRLYGDVNGDGFVDVTDFAQGFRLNFGTSR